MDASGSRMSHTRPVVMVPEATGCHCHLSLDTSRLASSDLLNSAVSSRPWSEPVSQTRLPLRFCLFGSQYILWEARNQPHKNRTVLFRGRSKVKTPCASGSYFVAMFISKGWLRLSSVCMAFLLLDLVRGFSSSSISIRNDKRQLLYPKAFAPQQPRTSRRNPFLQRYLPVTQSFPRPGFLLEAHGIFGNFELSNVFYDDSSMAFDAWEWTANIGAPAALVAGAVLVTLSETREDLAPRKSDKSFVRILKQAMRYMLLTSFALEVVSIFVGTMTGSVLLGQGPQSKASMLIGYQSPLQLLHHHHEFEYLTTQICFLQGLFNWLIAVAIELLLPKERETISAKKVNRSLAAWLTTLVLWMLAFYNNHLSFYSDYATMLWRFGALFVRRYILTNPFRPMSLLYGPSFLLSSFWTWQAFRSAPEADDD